MKILTATELHCLENLYEELALSVNKHKPDIVALVGDFLNAFGSPPKRLSPAQCAKALAALPCTDVLFVRGNHEFDNWWDFEEAWVNTGRKMHALHGESFVTGPLGLLGSLVTWEMKLHLSEIALLYLFRRADGFRHFCVGTALQ